MTCLFPATPHLFHTEIRRGRACGPAARLCQQLKTMAQLN